MVLSKTAAEDKEIIVLDIVTTFLESHIEEEIYLRLPKDFALSKHGRVTLVMNGEEEGRGKNPDSNMIMRLERSLYGLKPAGHNWYHILESHFTERMKIKPSIYEAEIYISSSRATIIIWVDDLLLIGTKKEVADMKKKICLRSQIKDLGNIKFFLSMLVEHDRKSKTLFLS